MSETAPQSTRPSRREVLSAALHVWVLAAFAVMQPLLELLGRNPTFFVAHDSSSADIITLVILLGIGVALVPIAVELVAALVSRRAHRAVHLVIVFGLGVAIALPVLRDIDQLSPYVVVLLALLVGVVVGVLYVRTRALQLLLSVLLPAPLLFALLFFGRADVRELLSPPKAAAASPTVVSNTPVVLLLFDELPISSLMTPNKQIDAQRFPHLAALQRESHWFRNATTVADFTQHAVPAILTGSRPTRNTPPTLTNYPRNLFTMLQSSHDLHLEEHLTDLCPVGVCESQQRRPSYPSRIRTLVEDSAVVYAHRLTPYSWRHRLPSIDNSWGNFADKGQPSPGAAGPVAIKPGGSVATLRRALEESDPSKPGLYYEHMVMAHLPWRTLPSGRKYINDGRPEGIVGDAGGGQWTKDQEPVTLGLQRQMLTVKHVDETVGQMVALLKAKGVYDKAVFVVVSDHGTAFLPGRGRRLLDDVNRNQIAPVALFVRTPGQVRPEVHDDNVQTIDVVPTIADLLDVETGWKFDGHSALGEPAALPSQKQLLAELSKQPVVFDAALPARFTLSELVASTFPHRTDASDLFAFGPYASAVGRRVSDLASGAGGTVRLDDAGLFGRARAPVEPLPARILGTVTGGVAAGSTVVAAVDGVVRGTGLAYTWDGRTRFSVMLPEAVLRSGAATVSLYAVTGPATAPVLHPLTS